MMKTLAWENPPSFSQFPNWSLNLLFSTFKMIPIHSKDFGQNRQIPF